MSRADSILVEVDPDLADLVPEYLENRRRELPQLRELLAVGDFDTIRRLAHDMKGSGGGYGFEPLTEFGAEMEHAAKAGDHTTIERCLDQIAAYLERVEVVVPA